MPISSAASSASGSIRRQYLRARGHLPVGSAWAILAAPRGWKASSAGRPRRTRRPSTLTALGGCTTYDLAACQKCATGLAGAPRWNFAVARGIGREPLSRAAASARRLFRNCRAGRAGDPSFIWNSMMVVKGCGNIFHVTSLCFHAFGIQSAKLAGASPGACLRLAEGISGSGGHAPARLLE